jgi:16S rRNA (guanine966-N2)-methyltransferase
VRVISGELRGRRFTAPKGTATRPTSDRVREAVFSIIADHVPGARVLDLFAGSGAMAIEALSRGAASAVLVESDRHTLRVLEHNLFELGLSGRASTLCAPVERFLAASPPPGHALAADGGPAANASAPPKGPSTGPFDLIFADPPYRIGPALAAGILTDVARRGWMSPGALIVWEHAAGAPPEAPDGIRLAKTRRYGDTQISIFEEEPASPRH